MNDSFNKHLLSAHYVSDSKVYPREEKMNEIRPSSHGAPLKAEETAMVNTGNILQYQNVYTQSLGHPGGNNQSKFDRDIGVEPGHINKFMVWLCSPS